MINDPPKEACAGWTVSTLFTHLTAMMSAMEKAVMIAQTAADRAVTKAEAAQEKRLDLLNEFKKALEDQTRTYMPRLEAELRMKAIEERLASWERQQSAGVGKSEGLSQGVVILISVGSLLVGFAGLLFGLLKH